MLINYAPDIISDFSQENIVRFGNPISIVLGEFYSDAVDERTAELLWAFWYSYSENYWYEFANALIGDIDALFKAFPIVF